MEITQSKRGSYMHVAVSGRLDSYWADHLNATLNTIVQQGHHRIRLDCANVAFLSSAGISVLVRAHKTLTGISGTFHVVNPSAPVATVLRVTRLYDALVDPVASDAPATMRMRARRVHDGVVFELFDLGSTSGLTCRALGLTPSIDAAATATECTSVEGLSPAIMVGVGAFGDGFEDCRARFGELLSIGGNTVYQPADGTNVADYLIATGPLAGDIQLLYGLACEGDFSVLLRFESAGADMPVALGRLLSACMEATENRSIGVAIIAETTGLVGAALRQSPVSKTDDFFAFPSVRGRLSYTAERVFPRSLALIGGVVTREASGAQHPQLRPVSDSLSGHLHAAAFRFSPMKKGEIELGPTIATLFESDRLQGVLHVLNDDRGAAGAGETELIRGACWVGPIRPGWLPS